MELDRELYEALLWLPVVSAVRKLDWIVPSLSPRKAVLLGWKLEFGVRYYSVPRHSIISYCLDVGKTEHIGKLRGVVM